MLKGDLESLTAEVGRRHNCSTALSVLGGSAGLNLTVGAGNGSTTFLWGSVTKTFTGAAIMQLVAQGAITLDDRAEVYIDPELQRAGYPYSSMRSLFSADPWAVCHNTDSCSKLNASEMTIRHLMGMESGILNYDTAAYRHLQYNHPSTACAL